MPQEKEEQGHNLIDQIKPQARCPWGSKCIRKGIHRTWSGLQKELKEISTNKKKKGR